MAIAVPRYVDREAVKGAPPGHRFALYYDGWWNRELELERLEKAKRERRALEQQNASRKKIEGCDRKIKKHQQRLNEGEEYGELDDEMKRKALVALQDTATSSWPKDSVALLARRQAMLSSVSSSAVYDARTAAPLLTGTGMEHPSENGLAFLWPYGLPYLPGSSVKGTLRQAVEQLVLFEPDSKGWGPSELLFAFGFDATSAWADPRADGHAEWAETFDEALERQLAEQPDALRWLERPLREAGWDGEPAEGLRSLRQESNAVLRRGLHFRGALRCWDALIDVSKKGMRCDILNPHHKAYYESPDGGDGPHDAEPPVPVYFLAVPPEATVSFAFEFVPPTGLEGPPGFAVRWRDLLHAALSHAAEWVGFGAKTAAGYGRLDQLRERKKHSDERWEGARVRYVAGERRLEAKLGDRWAKLEGEEAAKLAEELANDLSNRQRKRLRDEGVEVLAVRVRFDEEAGVHRLLGIERSSGGGEEGPSDPSPAPEKGGQKERRRKKKEKRRKKRKGG